MQSNLSVSNMLNLDFESVLKIFLYSQITNEFNFFLLLVLLSWIKMNKNLMHHIWWIWCNFLCIRRGTDPNWSFYLKFLFNGLRCHFNYINIKKNKIKTNPIYLGLFLNVSIVSSCSIHVLSSLFLFFFFWVMCTYLLSYMSFSINSSGISKILVDIFMGTS